MVILCSRKCVEKCFGEPPRKLGESVRRKRKFVVTRLHQGPEKRGGYRVEGPLSLENPMYWAMLYGPKIIG